VTLSFSDLVSDDAVTIDQKQIGCASGQLNDQSALLFLSQLVCPRKSQPDDSIFRVFLNR